MKNRPISSPMMASVNRSKNVLLDWGSNTAVSMSCVTGTLNTKKTHAVKRVKSLLCCCSYNNFPNILPYLYHPVFYHTIVCLLYPSSSLQTQWLKLGPFHLEVQKTPPNVFVVVRSWGFEIIELPIEICPELKCSQLRTRGIKISSVEDNEISVCMNGGSVAFLFK